MEGAGGLAVLDGCRVNIFIFNTSRSAGFRQGILVNSTYEAMHSIMKANGLPTFYQGISSIGSFSSLLSILAVFLLLHLSRAEPEPRAA